MPGVYIVSDNITSPIGLTTAGNFLQLKENISGIRLQDNRDLSDEPFYASLFDEDSEVFATGDSRYTRFEQLLVHSIRETLEKSTIDPADKKTILIISSTKGNIDLLEKATTDPGIKKKMPIHASAKLIAAHFGFSNPALVISNACISGSLAILAAKRLIGSGQYENAVIAGADIISKFVLSGFQSFQAISPEPCRPFDRNRKGISLGEGAATIILSSHQQYAGSVKVVSGGVSNDANHISAPSRTGDELGYIIKKAIQEASLSADDIGLISAHGTATLYNDEMEAKAITGAGLEAVPTNSLKGFYGHTLGAAGLIESIISVQSMQHGLVLPTKGFEEMDTATQLTISNTIQYRPVQNCIKTASGFGGCNAVLVFSK